MQETVNQLIDALDRNMKYCDWVNKQSVNAYFKELQTEIKELKFAIENNDLKNIKEELGDVIWDTFMLAKIAECKNGINTKQVIEEVITKIKRRKPYIFEGKKVSLEEANRLWREAKLAETSK